MLSFRELQEKKSKIKINPKKEDVIEGAATVDKIKNNHGDDCGCMKCDKKRRKEDLGDEQTVSTEETAYVSQEEVSEESDQSIDQEETSDLLTFKQFNEGRAEDAQKSLDKVKKRQKVLDKYEKDTGRKADIKKTPEYKQHKMRFPGAKRTGKKVPGAKETELQQHNRRVSKHNERLMKRGPTKKEAERQKGYDAYEKKHKRGNKSVWD